MSQTAPEDEPQPLDDPTGFGPEDVLGNGPVSRSDVQEPPPGHPGDPELDDDAETEPTA